MAEKFLFSKSFDDPTPEGTLPLSEVETLKQKAFEEGRQKGLAEAAEANETRAVELLPFLQAHLDQAVEIERGKLQDITKHASLISAKILERVFPVLNKRGATEEVCNFIENGLQQCPENMSCVITVCPILQADVHKYIDRLVPPVAIQVEIEETFNLTDCRIQWGDGGVEKLNQSIIAQVNEGLSRLSETNLELKLEDQKSPTEEVTNDSQGDIIDSNKQETQPNGHAESDVKESNSDG